MSAPGSLWPSISTPLMHHLRGQERALEAFRKRLPGASPLRAWVPERAETPAMKTAIGTINRVKAPGSTPKPADFAAIAAAFDHPGDH